MVVTLSEGARAKFSSWVETDISGGHGTTPVRAGDEVAVADNFARRGYDLEMGVDSLVPIASLHRGSSAGRKCPARTSNSSWVT